jgi:hypothetical protein
MTKPDFTGTWKLNHGKSSLQIPAPESTIFVIEHSEPHFHLERTHVFGGNSDTLSIDLTMLAERLFPTPFSLQVSRLSHLSSSAVLSTHTSAIQ